MSTTEQRRRRVPFALFCGLIALYGSFVARGPQHNADSRLALTYSLVESHSLTIDHYAATTQDRARYGGHYYTDKAPGVSLVLAPLYALLRPLALDQPGASDRFVTRYLLTWLGLGIPAAAFCAWFFTWLEVLEPRVLPRLLVVLAYAAGSPALAFSTAAFGHVPAGMLLMLSLAALRRARLTGSAFWWAAGGVCLAAAFLCEYPAALPGVLIAAIGLLTFWRVALPTQRPQGIAGATSMYDRPAGRLGQLPSQRLHRVAGAALALCVGAAPLLLLLGAYHWAAFGAPWRPGYATLDPHAGYAAIQAQGFFGIGFPSPAVALGLVAGAKRGLLLYAPWAILAVPGALLHRTWSFHDWRVEASASAAVFGSLLLVNAGYAAWDGGASWGPRHLVPALPCLALLALPAAARWTRLATFLAGASVLLNVSGAATIGLPAPDWSSPIPQLVLPRTVNGQVGNNWGLLFGLHGWWTLLPLTLLVLCLVVWASQPARQAAARRTARISPIQIQ